MIIRLEQSPYWGHECYDPWAGKVTRWRDGQRASVLGCKWIGNWYTGGIIEFEAEPGDLVQYGINGKRGFEDLSELDFGVVNAWGFITFINEEEASQIWKERNERIRSAKKEESKQKRLRAAAECRQRKAANRSSDHSRTVDEREQGSAGTAAGPS